MEFKLMNVGGELYGNAEDLEVAKPHEGPKLERKPTHTDTRTGMQYAFQDNKLDSLLKGDKKANFEQDYHIKSLNGKVGIHFKTQR